MNRATVVETHISIIEQGRTGHVLIWASAPPNIFFLTKLKMIFSALC